MSVNRLLKFCFTGLRYFYRMSQYSRPKNKNSAWHKKYKFNFGGYAVQKFLRLYREKLWNEKRRLIKCVFFLYNYKITFKLMRLFLI